MKKIIIPFTSLFFLFSSCSLEEKLNDSITKEESVKILGAKEGLLSAYRQVRSFQTPDNQFSLQEQPSDEMAVPTRGTDWDDNGVWRELHLHTWKPVNSKIFNSWEALYKGLAFALDVETYKDITPVQRAQARFLQSLYIFNLTDLFGQVAMRAPGEDVFNLPSMQFSRTEAIDFTIKKLEAELPNLPYFNPAQTDIASKSAANALLAKMYLNRAVYKATDQNEMPQAGPFTFTAEDMNKVVEYCNLAMIGRNLQINYFENFAPNNQEISNELIFTSKNTKEVGGSLANFYYATLHYNQNPGGWNGFVTLTDLYNKFELKDTRLSSNVKGLTDVSGLKAGILLGQQIDKDGANIKDREGNPLIFTQDFSLQSSTETKGMRVIKYQPDYASLSRPQNDFAILRLADVMLMKAEALARLGNTTEALIIVNQIRTTRGASALTSLQLIDILDERARELYWEGHRRQDQIRFSTFLAPVQERNTTSDKHLLIFPIPPTKLAANSNLKQNPGY